MPPAASAPTTEPADVPTTTSAWESDQPVSDSSASRAPMSHAAPTTPPPPRTSPTRMPCKLPTLTRRQANRCSLAATLTRQDARARSRGYINHMGRRYLPHALALVGAFVVGALMMGLGRAGSAVA